MYLFFGAQIPTNFPRHFHRKVVEKSRLGEGMLSLTPHASPIVQELIFLGANTRPDQDHDRELTLALRSSGEQKVAFVGETLFLHSQDGIWRWSQQPSEYPLLLYFLDQEGLSIEFEKIRYILSPSPLFSQSLTQKNYIETFKKGNLWGLDLLLSTWGGEEYRDLTQRAKVSIGSDVFFLRPGDCLWWDGKRWSAESTFDEIGPIAKLISYTSTGADFHVWDETGFSSEHIHLPLQTHSFKPPELEKLILSIRPRSSSEISCQLGKRKVTIREGDWWVRIENRWRLIHRAADLEAYLHHQIVGELFIFEKVGSSKGRVTIKGHVFNPMRTCFEPISLVVQTEKRTSLKTSAAKDRLLLAKHRLTRSSKLSEEIGP